MAAPKQNASGMGVDSSGGPVIDPTQNVLDLVEAAVQRLDDLSILRDKHFHDIISLEREHNKQIWTLQMDRLEAVRNVDVGAVSTAANTAEARATTLANQVAAAAEAMRVAAEATRMTFTDTLNSAIKPLADAISVIQQWMNQQTGQRAQVVEQRDTRQDTRGNQQLVWQIVAVVATLAALWLATR
jgi:hypothetical protein